jgi:hypothetical protein
MRADRFTLSVRIALLLTGSFLLLMVTNGCRERPTSVSGAVTIDGRPLTVPPDARGTVVFQPDGGHGTMATGLLDSTGHFKLTTGSSQEVAQGKYYVTISVAQLLPNVENEERGAKLITPAKYGSPRDSGLAAVIKPGENQVTFDLVSNMDEESAKPPNSYSDASPSEGVSSSQSPTEN